MRWGPALVLLGASSLGAGCLGPGRPDAASPPGPATQPLTVWGAAGEPQEHGLVLWARTDRPAWVQGEVAVDGQLYRTELVWAGADTDHAVSLPLSGLPGGAPWAWTVRAAPGGDGLAPPFLPSGSAAASGRVAAPPAGDARAPLRLVLGGDLGGQEYCVEPGGSRILRAVLAFEAQVFLANGDMIYADGRCPPHAPDGRRNQPATVRSVADPRLDWQDAAAVQEVFFAHWRHNWADPALRELQAQSYYVGQWDDHEVINDFGAEWPAWLTKDPSRRGYRQLVAAGRHAFASYTPGVTAERVYRTLRWGADVQLFLADARSHRSPNARADGPHKTLLGPEQRGWLAAGLGSSASTWTLVSLDVPLSIPTGSAAFWAGRDGVANGLGDSRTPVGQQDRSQETGFEHELRGLLRVADAAGLTGLVFLSTDVHFPRVTRYAADFDGDGRPLVFHEVVSGPLRAWMGQPGPPDPSFGPTVLFEAGGVANFAVIDVEGEALTVRIVGENAETLPGGRVQLRAAP